jgi:hypothetical protein
MSVAVVLGVLWLAARMSDELLEMVPLLVVDEMSAVAGIS